MIWWYGVAFNSVFFTGMWVLTARFLHSNTSMLRAQLIAIPVIFLVNLWYSKSVSLATSQHVSIFVVTMLSVVLDAFLSLILGYAFLHQRPGMIQFLGGVIALVGIVMLNLKTA